MVRDEVMKHSSNTIKITRNDMTKQIDKNKTEMLGKIAE